MKNFKFALVLLFGMVATSWSVTIPIVSRIQEKLNWDWAAVSQMILVRYGFYPSQTAIAAWATPGESNGGISMNLPNGTRHSMQELLAHYGISSSYYDRALTEAELQAELSAGHLVVAGRLSGMMLVYGWSPPYVTYMEPWIGMGGIMTSSYTDLINDAEYSWNRTLVITSPVGSLPSRPVDESMIPRSYGLYAFDQLTVNDGAYCYANPNTTSEFCQIGSGYARGLTTYTDTYGMIVGAYAKAGTARSSGAVWMRSNSALDALVMSDITKLETQNPVTLGSLTQGVVAYEGLGGELSIILELLEQHV